MLKEYLKQKNISIYSLSKKAKIPYSTLNDLCNNKVEIDNCKVKILVNIANALNISMKTLYDICTNKENTIKVQDTVATIIVKNKKYYIKYEQNNKTNLVELFKVNNTNSIYVKNAAIWTLEDKLTDSQMEELYTKHKSD